MPILLRNFVLATLLSLLTITSTAQQTYPTAADLTVKAQIDKLSPQSKISVVRRGADEEFGTFLFNDQQGFTFHDIDLNRDVTLRYGEVKKIKNGYGGYNSVRGRHTDHTKVIVISIVIIAAFGAFIARAVTAKN